MTRLLIAGYGFLGTSLELGFVRAGWQVDKISRSGNDGCMACDLSLQTAVAALPGDYDLIIHCAASGGGGEESYRKVYLEGSRNLLERFPHAHLIFTSSTSVYAQRDHSVVTEESLAEPVTATASILRESENLVLAAGGTVVRLSGLYGPSRCHVLKNFLNGTASIDGNGERIMNFIHRDDVTRAMLLLSAIGELSAGEIYNVTAEPITQYDCYAELADHFKESMPVAAPDLLQRKRGNSSKRVSNKKLKSLGWQPQYQDFLPMSLACDIHYLGA